MQASLDLAEGGFHVYLVEASPAIGGVMAKLDKTFPTNDCSMCMISPRLVEVSRHPEIEVLAYSELESLEGELGNFQAFVSRKPRYVHEDRCIACYRCVEACVFQEPKFENEFDEGLGLRKPVYIPFPQAIPLASIIDPRYCIHFLSGKCPQRCREACPRGAIDFDQQEEHVKLDVGAVVLATGCEPFDARLQEEYGFGRWENVVTSLQFERILSASGPYRGEIRRPGDGEHPKRIAFIQCAGSRDLRHNGYCSSVCCVYTAKEALVAKEHDPKLELTVFYIDLRAFSKGFEQFVSRAKSSGVRYVRSMISQVVELPSGNLLLRYRGGDEFVEEEFDLVVLAVGLEPGSGSYELGRKLGIELNRYGFAATGPFCPLRTSRRGIYVAGGFSGPKDIPESVVQASGAAAEVEAALSRLKGGVPAKIKRKQPPAERETSPEPRIGVFVCHCGSNIAGVVDVKSVARYAAGLPNVAHAEDILYTCSQDSLEHIKDVIASRGLDRLVVASCTPRTHEPLFQETIREVGLNKFLFEMVDIREQCAWVHSDQPERATEKAQQLVRMGVAKARRLKPLPTQEIGMNPAALVIGGGLSGMVAALALADNGYQVHLLERGKELGGNLRRIYRTLDGAEVRPFLEELVARVVQHSKVQLYLEAQLGGFSGFVGNFTTSISTPQGERSLEHGVVIVATGGEEYRPTEYLYGEDSRVVTQLELEELLHREQRRLDAVRSAVMIQCVGSLDEERPYCSRTCCSRAVKNALSLIEQDPDRRIYVLYREMRTYGFMEDFYRRAREAGIIFIRYGGDRKPQVELKDGDISVTVRDESIEREILIVPDLLVLSTGIVPDPGNEELSRLLKVPRDNDRFFSEAHLKLRPVDFASSGIFLCGLGHSPGTIPELIARAKAAASRAATLLAQERLEAGGVVAQVDPERCTACLACVRECPYAAIAINKDGAAEVNPALCQGCGICAADCPAKAIQLQGFEDSQELVMVEELLRV